MVCEDKWTILIVFCLNFYLLFICYCLLSVHHIISIFAWPGWSCSWGSQVSQGSLWFQDTSGALPYRFSHNFSSAFKEEANLRISYVTLWIRLNYRHWRTVVNIYDDYSRYPLEMTSDEICCLCTVSFSCLGLSWKYYIALMVALGNMSIGNVFCKLAWQPIGDDSPSVLLLLINVIRKKYMADKFIYFSLVPSVFIFLSFQVYIEVGQKKKVYLELFLEVIIDQLWITN